MSVSCPDAGEEDGMRLASPLAGSLRTVYRSLTAHLPLSNELVRSFVGHLRRRTLRVLFSILPGESGRFPGASLASAELEVQSV